MSQEREFQMLKEFGKNPCQAISRVNEKLVEIKKMHSGPKGDNSEIIIEFLIKRIPRVLSVKPYHDFVGDLDGDLICEIEGIAPVFVQVKTSDTDTHKFMGKIRRRLDRGIKHRVVALSFETPFDEIIEDFVAQINELEGHRVLKPIKF